MIPAAGSGSRMAASKPKQYLTLLHQPVLAHTIERLATCPGLKGVLVGLAEDDLEWQTVKDLVSHMPAPVEVYSGGAERAQTVLNGLNVLASNSADGDWVLVHDAARPCVRHDDILRLIEVVGDHRDGGILGVAMSDTVKRTDPEGVILETVARENLWRAVTPQLFPVKHLRAALKRALNENVMITDEASAIEHAGGHPRVVRGRADNIKITYPDDLGLAEMILNREKYEGEV